MIQKLLFWPFPTDGSKYYPIKEPILHLPDKKEDNIDFFVIFPFMTLLFNFEQNYMRYLQNIHAHETGIYGSLFNNEGIGVV